MPRLRPSLVLLLLAVTLPLSAAGAAGAAENPEAVGDRLWARRAEGFATARRVDPALAEGVVQAYEQALRLRPRDLRLRGKLVEALYFAGHFADADADKARSRFDRAVEVSDEACAQVAKAAGSPAGDPEAPLEARVAALSRVPGAIDAHFWAAISWGLWGMSHGNLAAAFHDVAGKIRDHAAIVAALDPAYRDAAGWRILGRLHAQVPKVPMFTDWVDRDQGIELLRKATAAAPRDARNPLFLAEALLGDRPDERGQALALLREVAARTPSPEALVEESEMIADARRLLEKAGTEASR